jgi:cell division protein FtsW (lipid II flippase)
MMISGSRGPLAIIGVGGMVYLIMSKRVAIASVGAVVGGGLYAFLRYTTILQGNYNVARLRSAFDPNDASMLVRKAKEAVLSVYMADKPIGGGIGSAGLWGERFAPGSFLANTPTDGLYSRIWMETGIIGLYLYLGLILFLVGIMGYRLWFLPEGKVKQVLLAMYSGFIGVVVASYVNEILGQLPLSIICYSTPALILLVEHWYKQGINIEDPPADPSPPLD